MLATLLVEIFSSLRHGEVGLDVVAALSMGASIAFDAPLAGIVVALMYSGGQYLEAFAEGRARREMTALLGRVARTAMLFRDGSLEETPIDAIRPGDRLLIRPGEVVPVDGIAADPAVLDESTLTGESLPVERPAGAEVLSGTTSVGTAFTLTATRPAAESAYARIVQLVAAAQRSKAPMSRLADRYAMVFLAVTVAVAGGAWFVTGDPLRALAVLVVATPCPLILAVPVAIISRGVALREGRAPRQGRRCARGAGAGPGRRPRQDGHADGGRGGARGDSRHRHPAGRRGAAPRRLARPGLQPRRRRGHCRRGAGAGAAPVAADGHRRIAGNRYRRNR